MISDKKYFKVTTLVTLGELCVIEEGFFYLVLGLLFDISEVAKDKFLNLMFYRLILTPNFEISSLMG